MELSFRHLLTRTGKTQRKMNESTKSWKRRQHDPRYADYIQGDVIDIGCGEDPITSEMYPNIKSVMPYDLILGHKSAETLPEIPEATRFDCIHSSHCLEHLSRPDAALRRWVELLKPGGHIVATIPEKRLYEKSGWPSRWNGDHKYAFCILEMGVVAAESAKKWPLSINVLQLLIDLQQHFNLTTPIQIKVVQLLDHGVRLDLPERDDTRHGCECAIEIVLQKMS